VKSLVHNRHKAIELRKLGRSYKEIMHLVPVAKGTLSGWLKNIEMTKEQVKNLENRLRDIQDNGRTKSAITNKAKRLEREKDALTKARVTFNKFVNHPLFIPGVILYWAEGARKAGVFQFVNSDPNMVKLMLKWIDLFMEIDKNELRYRLFMHEPYRNENCEKFWAHFLNVSENLFQKTILKPTPHKVKKNPNYKGCFRVTIGKKHNLLKVLAWQKLLLEYYKMV
jgi:hypothetical protein